jgi:hypothetical protein
VVSAGLLNHKNALPVKLSVQQTLAYTKESDRWANGNDEGSFPHPTSAQLCPSIRFFHFFHSAWHLELTILSFMVSTVPHRRVALNAVRTTWQQFNNQHTWSARLGSVQAGEMTTRIADKDHHEAACISRVGCTR